jgi:hypothetical protein
MRPTFTQESDFREQRDFGQKFSATFDFISAHWRGLGRALLYIVLPAALIRGVLASLFQQQLLSNPGRTTGRFRGSAGMFEQLALVGRMTSTPLYWFSISMGIAFFTLLVLTVYSYVLLCMRPGYGTQPVTPGEVWQVVKEHLIGAFFSYFGLALLLLLGFVFFMVPGIYLSVGLSLFFAVKVFEGKGFGASISRSLQLTRGKWWSTFGLLFVMFLTLFIVMGVIGATIGALAITFPRQMLGGYQNFMQVFTIAISALSGFINLLIYPPILLAIAFQYFNLVERQDGTGLRNMVNQLGQAPVAVRNADLQADDEGEY